MRAVNLLTMVVFLVMFLFMLPVLTSALEPAKEPILRIETGMHTAGINRISTDAQNRFLVTGSYDKTIRVWETATGRLLKTLRPPIGEGDEGKIYAVAISPDGKTVAAGGWTGYDWDEFDVIYIFDIEKGSIKKRLTKLPSNIFHIVYSRDGRYLAASLARDNGIRIYDAADYKLIATDSDYGNDTYGLDFSPDGRLATASYDGFIRIYDSDFRLIAKKRVPGGRQPYSVRFSPDGQHLAVGFNDSTAVIVLDADDIAPVFFPDVSGMDNGDLSKVSWSADGSTLYAGGRYSVGGINPVVKWENGGRGKKILLETAQDTIMHIIPLNNGGIAYCTSEPSFGIYDREGKKILDKKSLIADLRMAQEDFLISSDGKTVRFNYEGARKSPATFSATERILTLDGPQSDELKPPLTSAQGIEITEWQFSNAPKFNTVPLRLKQFEMSRSVAVSGAGDVFALGTEWYLRVYDREGTEVLQVPTPGAVWAVNIPPSGGLLVAALADGTIRWYSIEDGYELLAFFPHNDKKRWVLWTPSGYYEASEGAEEIIGWHKNRGKDKEAEFLPAEAFKKYKRPDIISLVLETLSEEEALQIAGASDEHTKRSGWRVIKKPPTPLRKSRARRRR